MLWLSVELGPGDTLTADAAPEAAKLARKLGCGVVFTVNGIEVRVAPGDTAQQVIKRYNQQYAERHERGG